MKTQMFLVAAALMIFASLGFGQGFNAQIYDDLHPLLVNCNGAPIADDPAGDPGSLYIFWDANNNGPDPSDVQPVVGTDPGQVNFNRFRLAGANDLGIPGGFVTGDDFSMVGITPSVSRWYVKHSCGNAFDWVSAAFTISVGPNVIELNDWTCTPCGPPPCTPTPEVLFYRDPVPSYFCANLCLGAQTLLRVCPNPGSPALDPTKPPIVTVTSGCTGDGCNTQCTPGQFVYNGAGWVYDPATGCFVNVITGVADNTCVCVALTGFLAAGIDNFNGEAGSNEVTLSWLSHNDASVLSYSIVRDGHVVGNVASTNGTSDHNYSYTDRSALNGTTYTYGLRLNNSDGSVTNYNTTVTATPSLSNAVVTEYALLQNYPNPFNPTTEITFDVLKSNPVTLKVYNANGQIVATLINGTTYPDQSRHTVSFDASSLPSGLYFYTVKIGSDFSATKKMLLVK